MSELQLPGIDHDDFEVLFQALQSLESENSKTQLMGSMMAGLLSRDEEQFDDVSKRLKKEQDKQDRKHRELVEKIAILRVKLIMARRQLDQEIAEKVLRDAQKSE